MAAKLELKNVQANKVIAYFEGRLDVAVSSDIEEQLLEAVERDNIKHMIFNMEKVEYMSSSGFRVAIALLRKLKEEGGSLKICALKPTVKRIFDVIELTTLFEIYDTEEQALQA